MSGLEMTKPWLPLTIEALPSVPAQLGVYQLGDERGRVLTIGYAGGREPFGLRSALADECRDGQADARQVRFEVTHGYLTRWEELLMVHHAQHGELPPGNADHPHRLGRLSLG